VACGAGNSGSSNRADIVLQTEEPGSNRIGPEFPRRLSIRPSLYFTIDDSAGSPLAILVNYACHPVVFGPDNRLYSADFPGAMTREVERTF